MGNFNKIKVVEYVEASIKLAIMALESQIGIRATASVNLVLAKALDELRRTRERVAG